jgi:hypothetical protein
VPLATIADTPSLKWQLLNVTARTDVVRVRYDSPDGGFGNMVSRAINYESWVYMPVLYD